jgi:Arc/MetJ-type ribon-helix-helix transcriptional regulator
MEGQKGRFGFEANGKRLHPGPDRSRKVAVCRRIKARGTAMTVNLSPEIENRVKDELAAGQYRDVNQFVETAVQYFLDQRQRSQQRLQALRRIGQAVDDAGLYERVLVPSQE